MKRQHYLVLLWVYSERRASFSKYKTVNGPHLRAKQDKALYNASNSPTHTLAWQSSHARFWPDELTIYGLQGV